MLAPQVSATHVFVYVSKAHLHTPMCCRPAAYRTHALSQLKQATVGWEIRAASSLVISGGPHSPRYTHQTEAQTRTYKGHDACLCLLHVISLHRLLRFNYFYVCICGSCILQIGSLVRLVSGFIVRVHRRLSAKRTETSLTKSCSHKTCVRQYTSKN